jgi:uridine monophosphate synthetase
LNERDILVELYEKRLIKTWYRDRPGGWTLLSGLWSPFYIQLRNLPSHPGLLRDIGRLLGERIAGVGDRVLGIAMAGIPLAAAVSFACDIPLCYTRKLAGVKTPDELRAYVHQYGEHSLVEGDMTDGDTFVAIDDIVTRFDSKLVALQQLELEAQKRHIAVRCTDVAVVLDRQQGAAEKATSCGVTIHSLIPFRDMLPALRDRMAEQEFRVITGYLEDPDSYQNPATRKDLL